MRVGVLRWVSSELLPLHKGYECWAKLEIVSLNCRLTMEEVMPDA